MQTSIMIESRSLVTWGCGKAGWGGMVGGYEWAQRNFCGIGYAHYLDCADGFMGICMLWGFIKLCTLGAPGCLSSLSICLRLRS